MNSSLVIRCVPLGCVMCLNSIKLYSINLCRYFRDIVGVNVGILFACASVSNGVGRRDNSVIMLLRWIPLVVLSKNMIHVIGDFIQS